MPSRRQRGFKKTRSINNRPNTNNNAFYKTIITQFLVMLNTIKLYHWKTRVYGDHKATDEAYASLGEKIDSFVEVMLGKTGERVDLMGVRSIPLVDFSNKEAFLKKINEYKGFLLGLDDEPFMKKMANTDLFNIRDDILGQMNQLLYLLSFEG
jgi:hypothetical protein